MQFHMDSDR